MQRRFSTQNTLTGSLSSDRSVSLRVMSTPTWPVPYYDRAFRHPANIDDRDKGNLAFIGIPVGDAHAMIAKELLKLEGKGHVVEAVEQHWQINNYMTRFDSSKQFCDAYVDDLLDCLNVAHEQNVRLLDEHDLADVL